MAKHISEHSTLYQVRIVRAKKVYSRAFSFRIWGSKKKAFDAAESWRDQMLASLGPTSSYLHTRTASARNLATGIRGVTRYEAIDKNGVAYIRYGVSYKEKGRQLVKSFQAGRASCLSADDDMHAFLTARQVRLDYLNSLGDGPAFNPRGYSNWKQVRIYDGNKPR